MEKETRVTRFLGVYIKFCPENLFPSRSISSPYPPPAAERARVSSTRPIGEASGSAIHGGGGREEDDHAQELRRRGVRGGGGGGDGVADQPLCDRGHLRRQRHPAAQRRLQDPRQGHRILHQARPRRRRRIQGRQPLHRRRRQLRRRQQQLLHSRRLRRGPQELGRRLRQDRPGHPLRSHRGCKLSQHQGVAGPYLPNCC